MSDIFWLQNILRTSSNVLVVGETVGQSLVIRYEKKQRKENLYEIVWSKNKLRLGILKSAKKINFPMSLGTGDIFIVKEKFCFRDSSHTKSSLVLGFKNIRL